MPIEFKNNTFHIFNDYISYCIELSEYGDLLHLYYGKRIDSDGIYIIKRDRASFSPYEPNDNKYSLDVLPQEYPMFGAQDMRSEALSFEYADGRYDFCNLRYKAYEICEGKVSPEALPHVYENCSGEFTTLKITIGDDISGIYADLYYSVSESLPVICRHSVIRSEKDTVYITNAASASIDFHDYDFKYMHLHGAWIREKHIETADVKKGFQGIESRRGSSGSCENPFLALMRKDAGEDFGEVYGFSLVYSGNFRMMMEVEQYGTMRVTAGINPHNFKWKLSAGEKFSAPEVVMAYSDEGLGKMSRTYHKLYRKNLCRGVWRDKERPILVNNWEATYFDFDEEKLLDIAKRAAKLGIELFVLDDGWFGHRNDDRTSLGDWFVNTDKLPHSLSGLSKNVNGLGIDFGLWVEPEMISKDSELFRKHPDWALQIAGREMHEGRNQYVLDMSRDDVVKYLTNIFTEVIGSANIKYIKWDMNRNISDANSALLPPDRQGEVMHRYILGVYRLMENLTNAFPEILFEGCSGGAGRNDPGILYYMPQNWGSDDTDAVERMYIQYGASMVYPSSSVCAHVSTVPNHQMNRTTPMKLRSDVAMSGVMGYEFDLSKLSDEEEEELKSQIEQYKRIRSIVCFGDMYRLINPFESRSASYMYVTEDKKKAVVFYFNKLAKPNSEIRRLKLKGLCPDAAYIVDGTEYSGKTLMNFGLYLPEYEKDFESKVWEISAK